jgi:trimeric autotransporter adhesin
MRTIIVKLFVAGLLLSTFAWSQSFQGSLRGKVVDPAGAVAEGAKLILINESTQVRRTTATNNQGEFVFAAVTPATYTVAVEATGFKRLERHGVAIATQSNTTLDLSLEIGRISEEVTVSAQTPMVQNSDASNGLLLDNQKITDLPSLGRNTFFTAKLAESVVLVGSPKSTRMQDQNANSQVSVLGGPVRSNNYLIDGVSISDITNRATILPSPEAVQEIKLQSSTYDAEVGRSAGGTFNSVLRSGANQLHGSALGYIRQTDWLANNFFANRAGTPRVDQPFRNWAGSFGGPVVIPHIYDGQNKTFFFFSTEHYRQHDASSTRLSVPTAKERIGDFSESFTKTGALQVIYDPLTTQASGARTAFAGNIIPQNRLSAIGKTLASYLPLPNVPTSYFGAPNYDVSISIPNQGDQYSGKPEAAARWQVY